MVIVLRPHVSAEQTKQVLTAIQEGGHTGYQAGPSTIVVPKNDAHLEASLATLPQVEQVMAIDSPYPLASRAFKKEDTIIDVRGHIIGGDKVTVMAGPCSVESLDNLLEIAQTVKAAGGQFLRGGAFKPRSSPYSFQGHGEEGLKMLAIARDKTGLGIISEVMEPDKVALVSEYVDILQIGARNMQNYPLLREAGKSGKPVMLKRGLSGTIDEWLMAAEYILAQGNPNVILCERGIRTFETATRNTLDLNAVPVVQSLSHLPIIVDPSHGTGKSAFVRPMARAGVAAGASGVIVEIHPTPAKAWSDAAQTLDFDEFRALVDDVERISAALTVNRPLVHA
ncbi:3-deoxy-7-phosphoheptulonate synthase [Alicyclobacillus acidoterrestris]|uniref:3-deoxy-7-phosphoheptulonate synthase n=1 Tax=Alicyclobacillus suci TaxID=2816080 RepID=UPI00119410E9|nr:3-deoxy-7-phosphoheptulonate synthase [Alicyclobacillus suci]GEO26023.1 3-deoxy-7-phosphoheptulonate synthase [Alicyclobacillus acidoterrestris]